MVRDNKVIRSLKLNSAAHWVMPAPDPGCCESLEEYA
jgi:hypothetical protein